MKYSLIAVLILLFLYSGPLSGMPVPSEAPESPQGPLNSGGTEVPAGALTVRILVITVFAGMSLAGIIYLTDGEPDNNTTGYLLTAPLAAQGIFYLILDDDNTPEEPAVSDPEQPQENEKE